MSTNLGVKIADFGLAEIKTATSVASTNLKGSYLYFPPEFASKRGIVRHPQLSDVYSMGAALSELFSSHYFWFDNFEGFERRKEQFPVIHNLNLDLNMFW